MISIGSGADALHFDAFHVCFFVVSVLLLAACIWYRQELRERLGKQALEKERELAALVSRHEADLAAQTSRLSAETEGRRRDSELWDADRRALIDARDKAERQCGEIRQAAETAERRLAALEAQATERERAFVAERESLKALTEDVQAKFQQLADSALKSSQAQFIELADQQLKKHKEGAAGELKSLIQPIQETFGKFDQKVEAIQKVTAEDRATMQTQFASLMENMQKTQMTTENLTNALRAPKGGGRWGEETLRNVLEMAGLSAYCDFTEQSHSSTDTGAIRPDAVIQMPGGRQLVIDSKVSVDDFLRASEADDPDKRAAFLDSHARKVRAHVSQLGKKSYWAELSDAVDFVAMFIPGENFYAAALEHDRGLFDYAAKHKVIIVTPSTLIALAKAVAYGWRQEQAAQNAREVTDLARELHKRLAAMGDKVLKVGKALSGSVGAYNEMVGSLETSVLPQSRKFEAMGMDADGKAIPDLADVEDNVRQPKQGKDLLFDVSELPEAPSPRAISDGRRRQAF